MTGRVPRKYRAIAAKLIGRPLLSSEVVHHKDGNFRNNHPENLEIMDGREHTRLHAPQLRLSAYHEDFLLEAKENTAEDILWSHLSKLDLSEIAR